MTTVRVSRAAQRDLRAAVGYLAEVGGAGPAQDFAQSVDRLMQRLAIHPLTHAARPELGRDIRVAVVGSYLVLHQHRAHVEQVTILRVLHVRRDIGTDFRQLP